MSSVTNVTSDNFQAEVLESDVPVLVDFWGAFCGPCLRLSPVLEQLASEIEGRAKVVKVDVVVEEKLAVHFQIDLIPSLLVFKGGEVVSRLVGMKTKQELMAALGL